MKRIAELQAFVAGNAPGDDTATLELSRAAAAELLEEFRHASNVFAKKLLEDVTIFGRRLEVRMENTRLTGL